MLIKCSVAVGYNDGKNWRLKISLDLHEFVKYKVLLIPGIFTKKWTVKE